MGQPRRHGGAAEQRFDDGAQNGWEVGKAQQRFSLTHLITYFQIASQLNDEGWGEFSCKGASVSVWVPKN